MRTLRFLVDAQIIKKDPSCDFSGLVAGTKGYLYAGFSFTEEWEGVKVAAVFRHGKKEEIRPLVRRQCEIPADILSGEVFGVRLIGQKGDYKITTNEIKVRQEVR